MARSVLLVYTVVFVGSLLALRRPILGLAVYHALNLVRPQDILWTTLLNSRLSFWVALAVAAGWLWRRLTAARPRTAVAWQTVLILAYLLLKGLSAMFATASGAAFHHVEIVAKIVLLYCFTVTLVQSRQEFRLIAVVLACCLAFLGLWGNWRWYVVGVPGGPTGALAGPGWDVGGALADRTTFGAILSIGIPMCLFVFMAEGRRWTRWPLLASIPVLVNAVMLTFGRSAMLSMMAALGWSALRLRRPTLVAVGSAGRSAARVSPGWAADHRPPRHGANLRAGQIRKGTARANRAGKPGNTARRSSATCGQRNRNNHVGTETDRGKPPRDRRPETGSPLGLGPGQGPDTGPLAGLSPPRMAGV